VRDAAAAAACFDAFLYGRAVGERQRAWPRHVRCGSLTNVPRGVADAVQNELTKAKAAASRKQLLGSISSPKDESLDVRGDVCVSAFLCFCVSAFLRCFVSACQSARCKEARLRFTAASSRAR
jgi:hypothetical protein